MPPELPRAELALTPPRTVVFDFRRLEAIEQASGKSIVEYLQELTKQLVGDEKAPEPDAPPLSKEEQDRANAERGQRMAARWRWSTAAPFLAACLDTTVEGLAGVMPLQAAMPAFMALYEAFGAAVVAINGGGAEESPTDPRPAEPAAPAAG